MSSLDIEQIEQTEAIKRINHTLRDIHKELQRKNDILEKLLMQQKGGNNESIGKD